LQAEPRSHTPRVGQGDQGVLGQRLGCNKGALQVLPAARQQGEVGESRRETERETEREKERLRESERKRVQREERERYHREKARRLGRLEEVHVLSDFSDSSHRVASPVVHVSHHAQRALHMQRGVSTEGHGTGLAKSGTTGELQLGVGLLWSGDMDQGSSSRLQVP
jgi:hypothetical protein